MGLGLAVSLNVRGCSEYLCSGRSSIRAFINFPNNGGILSSCQVGIHSLSFWYQRTSVFFFEGQSLCSLHAVAKPRKAL